MSEKKITDNDYIQVVLSGMGVECYNHHHKTQREWMIKNHPCPANDRKLHQITYPHTYTDQIHNFMYIFGKYQDRSMQKEVSDNYRSAPSGLFEDIKIGKWEDFK